MTLQDDLDEIREAHLRAWLSGVDQLTLIEIRAIVRASIDARDKLLEGAHIVLTTVDPEACSVQAESVTFAIEQLQEKGKKL
jgi:hypothetical protein